MELLKKSLVIIAIATLSATAFAQDEIIKAFKNSYTLEQNGDYSKAADQLQKVYDANSYEINLRLGWLNYLGGKQPEAIIYYNKAIALKPYAIEPRFGLTYPLSMQGKWNDIINIYIKILEFDPQNSIANYRLGLIYYNTKNHEKAEPYLEKVINLYPFDYDALKLSAWNKLMLQKNREAKVLFNKVLMYSPDDASALEGLGLIK